MLELSQPILEEDQEFYLKQHKEDVKKKGIPTLMEEIFQKKIQTICGLNKIVADKWKDRVNQEVDNQIFWINQPLDSIKYSWDIGFLRICDVLTEDEFKEAYL